VAWSYTLYKHVANMQSDRTKQPHTTVQYFVYSHIQKDTVKWSRGKFYISNSQGFSICPAPRCHSPLYGTHWKILLFYDIFWTRKKITSGKYNVASWTWPADGFYM